MTYLLDTHTFLWWSEGDLRLPVKARKILAQEDADILVSIVTA